jgi:hypothetical protein
MREVFRVVVRLVKKNLSRLSLKNNKLLEMRQHSQLKLQKLNIPKNPQLQPPPKTTPSKK